MLLSSTLRQHVGEASADTDTDGVGEAAGRGRAVADRGRAAHGVALTHRRSDAGRDAAKIIQDALGIASDDVVNYCFPKSWPADREQRARIIGEWLQTEARYLA